MCTTFLHNNVSLKNWVASCCYVKTKHCTHAHPNPLLKQKKKKGSNSLQVSKLPFSCGSCGAWTMLANYLINTYHTHSFSISSYHCENVTEILKKAPRKLPNLCDKYPFTHSICKQQWRDSLSSVVLNTFGCSTCSRRHVWWCEQTWPTGSGTTGTCGLFGIGVALLDDVC